MGDTGTKADIERMEPVEIIEKKYRVAMGNCSPMAPTESVRADITAYGSSEFRFTTCFMTMSFTKVNTVSNLRRRQCKAFEEEVKARPRKTSVSIPALQPPLPATMYLTQEVPE